MTKRCLKLASLTQLTLAFCWSGLLPAAEPISNIELKGSSIERLDPRFDMLIAEGATIEKLAEGFQWAEGPVWNRKEGYLLFSDIPNNAVNRWQPGKRLSQFLRPSGYTGRTPREGELGSNGLLYDRQGRLVLCQHGDRRIARLEGKNKFKTLADKFKGKRFNSPNDGVFKSNGDLYFTDPPYGLVSEPDDPEQRR
ncbi:MAG TPA: SMP-30/gluconolactonase/LRE family protein, partial [Pirellulales bacterium]|nr:SMP-30/gluconolactonase/LRE family protein [Pirellulales bacterium]